MPVLLARGQTAQAQEALRALPGMIEDYRKEHPELNWRKLLLRYHMFACQMSFVPGQTKKAMDHAHQAAALAEQLLKEAPDHLDLQNQVAAMELTVANNLLACGEPIEAMEHVQMGLNHAFQLFNADPSNARSQLLLSSCHELAGDIRVADREYRAALDDYVRAVEIVNAIGERHPNNVDGASRYVSIVEKVGNLCLADGDLHSARGSYRTIKDVSKRAARNQLVDPELREAGVRARDLILVTRLTSSLGNVLAPPSILLFTWLGLSFSRQGGWAWVPAVAFLLLSMLVVVYVTLSYLIRWRLTKQTISELSAKQFRRGLHAVAMLVLCILLGWWLQAG